MIRVILTLQGNSMEQFYAEDSYQDTSEGRVLYWREEKTGDLISYPISEIKKIVEQDIEE